MRMVFLAGLVSCTALTAPALAASPAQNAYSWAQPGTALVAAPFSQPSASVLAFRVQAPPILTTYHWAQPGTAPVAVRDAQP
jgi:hypothetical protein